MFVEILPKLSVSEFMRIGLKATSHKIQSGVSNPKQKVLGKRFWSKGYFAPHLLMLQVK